MSTDSPQGRVGSPQYHNSNCVPELLLHLRVGQHVSFIALLGFLDPAVDGDRQRRAVNAPSLLGAYALLLSFPLKLPLGNEHLLLLLLLHFLDRVLQFCCSKKQVITKASRLEVLRRGTPPTCTLSLSPSLSLSLSLPLPLSLSLSLSVVDAP